MADIGQAPSSRTLPVRIGIYCLVGGLPLTVAALGTGGFVWCWLAGIALSTAFVPVALYGPRTALGQLGVIVPVLWIVTVLCTWSEALLFLREAFGPDPLSPLLATLVIHSLLAVWLVALARFLKLFRSSGPDVPKRSVPVALLMLLLSGAAYVIYYLVTGAITYTYFTRDYYPPETTDKVLELGVWFWVIQLTRGTLMALAVVPFIYTLRASRRFTAVAAGAVIWVAGGLAPLLVPNDLMPPLQRFIHIIEILTQNAPLGITVALLLRPPKNANCGAKPRGYRHAAT